MKKYFFLAPIGAAVLLLSGCGNAPANTANTPKPTYSFSQSIWKSTDEGKNFSAKTTVNEKPTVTDLDVLQIAVNPMDPNNIFVGLRSGGIVKTNDGGEHWDTTNFVSDKVYGIAIDPTSGQTIYASGVWQGRGKIFKSDDAGADWKEIYTKPANGPLVISLTIDKINPSIVYATTSDNEVIKSSDAGATWQNIYQDTSPVVKVAIDSVNDNLIYIFDLSGNIFSSTDGGKNFTDIGKNLSYQLVPNKNFTVMRTDPIKAGWVYLAGGGGIVRSQDAGKTWEKIVALDNPQNFPVSALAIDPHNSDEIIYGAAQAVYKSVDGGKNWSTYQFAVGKKVNAIEYDPTNTSTIYLGFSK